MSKSIRETLAVVNLEVKSNRGQAYISWMVLWDTLTKYYPEATYEFHEDINGYPYTNTPLGLFVKVSVTIQGLTRTIHRPVYNNAMKSMKVEPYEYTVKSGTKRVEGAVASDVNDALFRALAKCIGMFGLGTFVFKNEQYAELELIDSKELSELSNLIAKHNLDLGALNAVFGINRLSELASFNFESAINWINDNATKP